MTIPRIDTARTDLHTVGDQPTSQSADPTSSFWGLGRRLASRRRAARLERDVARGYSINVKQVLLAFAIEFLIIGLILTSQYSIAAEQSDRVLDALLFPIALAMVELARVPLAIAVRTQKFWNIKLAAAFGVASAVVVTSFSLSTIAYRTFDPRLTRANDKHNELRALEDQKQSLIAQKTTSEGAVEQKLKERDSLIDHINHVTSQLTAQQAQNCATVTIPNPTPGGSLLTKQSCRENPVLKPLQAELAGAKSALSEAEIALKQLQARADHHRNELREFDARRASAEAEYRRTINHSQLHSYTAMLFRKDPRDVSDGEVKTLEWYLIVIPSIAAALASTLIAITAVRNIEPKPGSVTTIPDEAVAYLFGPLLETIRTEARATVSETLNSSPRPRSSTALLKD
jgi:hypothetical protein